MTSEATPSLLPPPPPGEIRAEIEQLALDHLLGPEGGEHEELPGKHQVRDYYLLGMLAPQGAETPKEENDSSTDDSEEGEDDEPSSGPTLFPSSMGMTFAVEAGIDSIDVTASWGRYSRATSEIEDDEGKPRAVWRREPRGGTISVPLNGGRLDPQAPDAEYGDVVVSGIVRANDEAAVVTLFLVNEQEEQAQLRDEQWLFQAELSVAAVGEVPVFIRPHAASTAAGDGEVASLDMLYRNEVEFAAGHGTAVHVVVDADDPTRARRISTVTTPSYEVPQTQAPSPTDVPAMGDASFDMAALAESDDLQRDLQPLVDAYRAWIAERQEDLDAGVQGIGGHRDAADAALRTCREAADRIQAGIDLLAVDPNAEQAFRFANQAMAMQRIHTIAAEIRRNASDLKLADVLAEVDEPKNRSWRPFQLAFVLLNLPSLTDPENDERSEPGLVDLLWFPTGGGKTEAYLGLCAYALAIRRLQGEVGGLDGSDGVAIVMRYTLRLLTAQQFQRAAALICACEVIRREATKAGNRTWGDVPFRIGLWVGSNVTPNRGSAAERAIDQSRDRGSSSRGSNPVQLAICPWCGNEITAARNARYDNGRLRTLVYCSDSFGRCAFGQKHSKNEGLPVVTVDDEIYRLLPGLVIATADKFAQLPWQGQLTALFGRVTQRCERHGYRSPDLDAQIEEKDSHRARDPLPAAKTVPNKPLRPPDLIIQDELHLMTGPLGTLAGLYETAVDELCSWDLNGKHVRPKVVASTATVRRAWEQAHALFGRELEVFPPHGLDVTDSFFARQVPVSQGAPGRRYVGICAQGRRLKAVEIRIYVALMAAAQKVFDVNGVAADPWMTLVGYFSSLRDLGGMRRLVDDDVKSRLARIQERGLGQRYLNDVGELTSRMDSGEIPKTLDRLGVTFDPNRSKEGPFPIDVLLATNMISVGVDVPRLGLMVVDGQPKATAEYIQATSRVGRSKEGPGLVFAVCNWARPRDLSHYERFEHYHATFYRHVEATTLTPFAPRAIDRGLTGVLTSLLRHQVLELNGNEMAGAIDVDSTEVAEVADIIAARAQKVTGDVAIAQQVRAELNTRLLALSVRQARQKTGVLGYKERNDGQTSGVLQQANADHWDLWTCPNSLREVEPGINLIFDDTDYTIEPSYEYRTDGPEFDKSEDSA